GAKLEICALLSGTAVSLSDLRPPGQQPRIFYRTQRAARPLRQKQPINPDAQASIFPTAAARSTTQRAPSHQAHQQRKGQADGDAEGVDRPHGAGITAAPLTVGQGDRGHRRQKAQRQHLPDPGRQRQHPADGGGRQAESVAQQNHPQNVGPALLRNPRLQQQSDHQHRQKGVGLTEHPRHGVNRLRQAQAEQPQEQNGQKGVEGHGAEHSAQNGADRQALPAGEGGRQCIGAAAVEGAVARVKHGDGQQHVRRQKALHKGQDKGADIVAGGVEQVERPDGPRPPPGHQGGDSQQQD
ncbi:Cyn operon transcriptional activator, partial [Dysosmobacter welbionis]